MLLKRTLLATAVIATAAGMSAYRPVVIDPVPADTMSRYGAPSLPDSAKSYSAPVPEAPVAEPSVKLLTLSRQQCIEIALQDNPTIRVADMEIMRGDFSKKETRASLLPSVSFSGAYQRAIELQTITMDMGGHTQSLKMGSDNTWNFGFSASVPIVMPTLWKALEISDTQIMANWEAARSSRLNLVNQVSHAYYQLMLANASYDVVKENYENARYNADVYQKQFSFGTATEYDVLRSSVAVKNIEPELLQAQMAIDQASLQLQVLMGIGEKVTIRPDVTLAQMEQEMYGYQSAEGKSLANNTNLRTLDIQTRLLEQSVDLKKREFLPTLAGAININWNALSNGNALKNQEFHPYSTVGLSLSLPLFTGGSRYYGLKNAEVQVKQAKLQREDLVNQLQMQVELAVDNINKEIAQIDSSAEGVKQAVKAHEIMQKSFEIGAATFLNLRDSELARSSAKLTYYQAIYNYLVSLSDLDLLLGSDDELMRSGFIIPANTK